MFGGKVSTSAEPDFHQPVLRYRFEALEMSRELPRFGENRLNRILN